MNWFKYLGYLGLYLLKIINQCNFVEAWRDNFNPENRDNFGKLFNIGKISPIALLPGQFSEEISALAIAK